MSSQPDRRTQFGKIFIVSSGNFLELKLKSRDDPIRRIELITGNGRRRDWSDDQKAQIIAESYEPGVTD